MSATQPEAAHRSDPSARGLWRDMLMVHRRTLAALEAELLATTGMSFAQYDVLLHLWEAPEHHLRMSELSDAVIFTTSGLTRLIDRMEAAGFVERGPATGDRRGVSATLTDTGAAAFKVAAKIHLAGVERLFLSRLDPGEVPALARTFSRLLAEPETAPTAK